MPIREFKNIKLELPRRSTDEMAQSSAAFFQTLRSRRSVRHFSSEAIPIEVIRNCLCAAGTAPSGANRQPWHFVVVGNPLLKSEIRRGAEAEENEFYQKLAPQDWLDALAPLGTDANKPFLETAPYLIIVFSEKFAVDGAGKKLKNYYVTESASIATGFLIAALHTAGLATLTHTPSPMKFLNSILQRPDTEKPLMIVVVGFPAADACVPDISRKSLNEIASFHL